MPTASRLLIALFALFLAGCSLTEDQPTDPHKRRPLKVQHARGETRVPYLSDRPVTVDPAALETALALGVKPLGSTSWQRGGRQPAYLRAQTAGVENLGFALTPDVTAVKRLDPDVIIGNNLSQKRYYDQFEEIAATVYSGVPLTEWKADVRFFGEALGRSDEGERLLIDWDRRVARVKRSLGSSRPDTITLPADLRRSLDRAFVDSVLEDVGFQAGAAFSHGNGGGIIAARRILDVVERQAAVR
ncbi:MAG TPA: ABC transporter substrate-binding protein [Thermoleophilaceae bacterium]